MLKTCRAQFGITEKKNIDLTKLQRSFICFDLFRYGFNQIRFFYTLVIQIKKKMVRNMCEQSIRLQVKLSSVILDCSYENR